MPAANSIGFHFSAQVSLKEGITEIRPKSRTPNSNGEIPPSALIAEIADVATPAVQVRAESPQESSKCYMVMECATVSREETLFPLCCHNTANAPSFPFSVHSEDIRERLQGVCNVM